MNFCLFQNLRGQDGGGGQDVRRKIVGQGLLFLTRDDDFPAGNRAGGALDVDGDAPRLVGGGDEQQAGVGGGEADEAAGDGNRLFDCTGGGVQLFHLIAQANPDLVVVRKNRRRAREGWRVGQLGRPKDFLQGKIAQAGFVGGGDENFVVVEELNVSGRVAGQFERADAMRLGADKGIPAPRAQNDGQQDDEAAHEPGAFAIGAFLGLAFSGLKRGKVESWRGGRLWRRGGGRRVARRDHFDAQTRHRRFACGGLFGDNPVGGPGAVGVAGGALHRPGHLSVARLNVK